MSYATGRPHAGQERKKSGVGRLRRLLSFGRTPTAPPAPEPGAEGELAHAGGQVFGPGPTPQWNPDELVGRRGYDVYRRMLHDDQVRALVSLKQAVVTSRRWRFEPARDGAADRDCAAFLRHVLTDHLEGTFTRTLQQMLSSQVYGFSVTEKVYAPVHWRGRALWGLRALKLRPAHTFRFETDPHGNLAALEQEQHGVPVRLPRERFVLHVNRPEVHPQYGESELRACHRHWRAKEHILQFWNVYLERMASGFVHGRINGPLTTAERDELKQVMRNLSAQTSIITPASVELDVVTAPPTDAFERAVAARDKAMAKALLVPQLLGFSEQGKTGSYSQSRTQMEAFFHVAASMAEALAETLNEQVVRELAWWNFGLVQPPRFVFDPLTDAEKREYARAWREAVRGGVVTNTPRDEAYTRQLLQYPQSSGT